MIEGVRGVVDIVVLQDGAVTQHITEENDICWNAWRMLLGVRVYPHASMNYNLSFPTKRDATTQNNGSADAWYIFYGSKPAKKTALNCWYSHDATVKVNQDTPYWTAGATVNDNDVVTFTANITPPVGSSRTIRTIGLYTPTISATASIHNKFTILPLSTPCIQDTNATIILTYRLILPPASTAAGNGYSISIYNEVRELLKRSCNSVASLQFTYYGSNTAITTSAYDFTEIYNICDVLGYRGAAYDASYLDSLELTDCGLMQPHINVSHYTNTIKHSATINTTNTPGMGTFAKTLILGGVGTSNYTNPLQIAVTQMYKQVLPNITNPLQNIFKQRNTPPGPFQDAATTGLMTGSITLDYANWVDPGLQKLFKINITSTGDINNATYNVDVMNYVGGFAGNRWMARTSFFPQVVTNTGYIKKPTTEQIYEGYPSYGATSFRSPDGYRYVAAVDCQRIATGITVYDVISGTKTQYDANSTSPLNVTAVSDGECAKGYIFVTCANTGLYRINPTTKVVEQIPSPTGTNKAYQICVKTDANNTLWVLFDGGLCKLNIAADSSSILTTDWTVYNSSSGSPTFNFTGITDGNWQYVTAMIIDPDNLSDDRFLFLRSNIASTADNYRQGFVWWCTSTGIASNPSTSGVPYILFTWNQTNLLRISDAIVCVGGYWWMGRSSTVEVFYQFGWSSYGSNDLNANYLTYGPYGSSPRVIRAVVNNITGGMITDSAGAGGVLTGAFFNPSTLVTVANGTSVYSNNALLEFPLRQGNTSYTNTIETNPGNILVGMLRSPLVYLPNSNLIFSLERSTGTFVAYGVTPLLLPPTHSKYATYKNAFWKSYGWDGSSWVLGNSGSKTLHSSLNDLPGLDGMRIAFTNGSSGTSFISGEWFITSVGKGLLKDNGTSYTYNLTWDLAPTEKIIISSTVPAAAPGLLTNEPLTFSPYDQMTTYVGAPLTNRLLQNKGILVSSGSGDGYYLSGDAMLMVSDQLIPASTDFSVKFKWITFSGSYPQKSMGLATGTSTYTYAFFFTYNQSTDAVELVEGSTVRATIATASLDVTKEFKIERVGSTITAYYDNVSLYSITNTSQFVVVARSSSYAHETGWYDMLITYTENRKILRIGDSGTSTGSYSTRFMGLSSSPLVNDTVVYLGSGTPLLATLDFTTAGVAVTAPGTVKVASGAGWLIFHNSEAVQAVTGSSIAHYVLNGM